MSQRTITVNVQADGSDWSPQITAAIEQAVAELVHDIVHIDYQSVLVSQYPLLEKIHAEYFAGRHGPNSTWAGLEASTIRKKGHAKLMVDSGSLRASLTGSGGVRRGGRTRKVGRLAIEFGTSVPYAQYHTEGFRTYRGKKQVPAREMVGLDHRSVDTLAERVADEIITRIQ